MIDMITHAVGFAPTLKSPQHPAPASSQSSNFASHLIDAVKQAETLAVGGMQGQVPMQEVVMKVMEAERAFSTAMAVRDKVVGAYLEISRMQI